MQKFDLRSAAAMPPMSCTVSRPADASSPSRARKADIFDANPPCRRPCSLIVNHASCPGTWAPHLYACQDCIALPEVRPRKILAKIKHLVAPVHAYDADGSPIQQAADHRPDIRADQLLALHVRRDGQIIPHIPESIEQVGASHVGYRNRG